MLRHHSLSLSSTMFNVTRTQYAKDRTLFTTLWQCWTVCRCQTPPLISIMCIILDQTIPFHVNLHSLVEVCESWHEKWFAFSCQPLHTTTCTIGSFAVLVKFWTYKHFFLHFAVTFENISRLSWAISMPPPPKKKIVEKLHN